MRIRPARFDRFHRLQGDVWVTGAGTVLRTNSGPLLLAHALSGFFEAAIHAVGDTILSSLETGEDLLISSRAHDGISIRLGSGDITASRAELHDAVISLRASLSEQVSNMIEQTSNLDPRVRARIRGSMQRTA